MQPLKNRKYTLLVLRGNANAVILDGMPRPSARLAVRTRNTSRCLGWQRPVL